MMTIPIARAFTAAQLLSAPVWGRFSDRYGRRPALLVGLTASCIAYVVFAYATSIWLLLLSRIVQGAGGGTVGVIQAYVADSDAGVRWNDPLFAIDAMVVIASIIICTWPPRIPVRAPSLPL